MKRILAILLVLVVSLTAFVGCEKLGIPGVELPEFKRPEIKLPAFLQPLFPNWGNKDNGGEEPVVEYDIEAAKEYVKQMYIETTVTTGDYEVIAQAMIAGVKYTVDWTVDNEKVKLTKNETTWTVDIDNKPTEEYTYKLTATITAGDNTQGTVSFDIKVPAYNLSSFEDYMNAKKGDILTVEGIVVAMCSKDAGAKRNHIYVADASGVGGYLNYNMTKDPVKDLGIQVGMTVTISGEISPSNGMQEFYQANVEIVDRTIKEVPVNDITAAFAAGGNLDNYVATLVTIKGVTIGGQSMAEANHQYLRFSIGEYGSYIRTYVTDFPSTLTGKDNTDKDIIDKAHADHFGWTANVTGILVYFTTSENPYLIPISTDCFEYLEFVEKSDADKVAYEKGNLTFEENLTTDTVIDLVVKGANYPEVTISWASDHNSVVIADGKATVTIPDETVTVKLTATLTCGNVTETKEFNVKLSKDLTPVEDAIEIALGKEHNTYTDGKYLVGGIITEVYNTTYGNMKITDEKGNVLTVYGTYGADGTERYDALASKPVAGDYVVVFGILGSYNDVAQMKNGWIISFTTPTSVKDAIDLGAAKDHNDFTGDKILVTGTVTEVYNTTYGNMYIEDADGNVLTIYGTYDATGTNRYDAMATKPVAGDVVTILGVPGRYNDTKQIKNGWIVAITPAADAGHTCVDADGNYVCDDAECAKVVLPEADSVLTIPQAKALAEALGAGNYSTNNYYITAEVVEVYNTTYGNMNVVDADGNTYVFYGAYDADNNRYDAMETKPVAGDVVTMYGVVGSYAKNGVINSYQLKDGVVTNIEGSEPPHTCEFVAGNVVAPTCTEDGYTVYACTCGKSENRDVVSALNHVGTETTTVTVDAKCGVAGSITVTCECGHVISTTELPALEHNYVDGVCQNGCGVPPEHTCEFVAGKVVDPTCTEDGYTVYACTCGKSENRDVVSALNHVGTETTTVTVDAKCGVAGSTTVTCECGHVISTTELPALEHVDEDGDFKCDHECGTVVEPADGTVLTLSQAKALASLFAHNTYTTNKFKVVVTVNSVYNTSYGNMYVSDDTCPDFTVYGTYDATGANRYDAMETKPVQYDVVTLYGVLGTYNNAVQMKNAWILEFTAHQCSEFTEATCTKAAECVLCGTENGEALGHTTEEGTCERCGQVFGSDAPAKVATSVSKSHTEIASIAGVTAGQNTGIISGKNIALNEDITIVAAKGGSTADPCIYTESIRLYQGGATVTVKAAEGCDMTTIVITLATKSGGQGPITVKGGTASSLSNYTYVITVDEGVSEVVITTAGTDKNNRLYVSNIEVNYEK